MVVEFVCDDKFLAGITLTLSSRLCVPTSYVLSWLQKHGLVMMPAPVFE